MRRLLETIAAWFENNDARQRAEVENHMLRDRIRQIHWRLSMCKSVTHDVGVAFMLADEVLENDL